MADNSASGVDAETGAIVTLKSVVLRNNLDGIFVAGGGLVRLATSTITNNTTGITHTTTTDVQTLEDNVIDGNGTDISAPALDTATVNYQ